MEPTAPSVPFRMPEARVDVSDRSSKRIYVWRTEHMIKYTCTCTLFPTLLLFISCSYVIHTSLAISLIFLICNIFFL